MKPDLRSYFDAHIEDMAALTRELTEIESPTDDKAAVDRLGARIAEELRALGADLHIHPRTEVGDIIEVYTVETLAPATSA
jgi:glutamate carboxypeptidase